MFPRPRLHFTPPRNWLNDPNGLIRMGDDWHLFYQHNPEGRDWGNMSWGHAVTTDWVHWEHQPLAMRYQAMPAAGMFSGTVVAPARAERGGEVRPEDELRAFFTVHRDDPEEREEVWSAIGHRHGRRVRFVQPHLALPVAERKFGDPKVFYHEASRCWVMVVIAGRPRGRIEFWTSTDLTTWDRRSSFVDTAFAGEMWECPDLFCLRSPDGQTHWILKVNGVTLAGWRRCTRYWRGHFDGTAFLAAARLAPPTRESDQYAELTFAGTGPDEVVQVGWIPQQPRNDRPWTGMMTLPCRLSLAPAMPGWCLAATVLPELAAILATPLRQRVRDGDRIDDSPAIGCVTWEIGPESCGGLVWTDKHGGGVRIIAATDGLHLTRGSEVRAILPWPGPAASHTVEVWLDHGVAEIFAAEGRIRHVLHLPAGALPESLFWQGEARELLISRICSSLEATHGD